jgi:hypothetical protein
MLVGILWMGFLPIAEAKVVWVKAGDMRGNSCGKFFCDLIVSPILRGNLGVC